MSTFDDGEFPCGLWGFPIYVKASYCILLKIGKYFVFIYFHLPVVELVILYYPSDQSIVGNIVYRP